MSELKDRLRIARERCGLTQLEASKRIDVSNRALSRYETGTAQPDPTTLRKFSLLYDVSVDWLLGLTQKMAPSAVGTSRAQPQISDELLRDIVKLSQSSDKLLQTVVNLSPASKAKLKDYIAMLQLLDAAEGGEDTADMKKRSS